MPSLGFEVIWIMITSVILTGGIALVVPQYYLKKIIFTKTIDKHKPES
jgi:hypothetical protein